MLRQYSFRPRIQHHTVRLTEEQASQINFKKLFFGALISSQ